MVVEQDALGGDRVAEQHAHRVAVRGHAVQTVIGSRDDDSDHLALGLGETWARSHEIVAVRPPLPEARLAPGEGAHDVGDKAQGRLQFSEQFL